MQDISLMQIGMVIIIVGVIFVIAGAIKASRSSETETKVAVGGFIGPIPFGFANDRAVLYILIGLMVFTLIVWIIFNFFK